VEGCSLREQVADFVHRLDHSFRAETTSVRPSIISMRLTARTSDSLSEVILEMFARRSRARQRAAINLIGTYRNGSAKNERRCKRSTVTSKSTNPVCNNAWPK